MSLSTGKMGLGPEVEDAEEMAEVEVAEVEEEEETDAALIGGGSSLGTGTNGGRIAFVPYAPSAAMCRHFVRQNVPP